MTNYPGKVPYSAGIKKLCSIIIPVYNLGNYVLETIDSIRNQTYTSWECILVDDGCTDDTIRLLNPVVNDDPRFSILKRPRNRPKGLSAARNVGFENCSGEFIQFFDGDDIMHPRHLEKKLDLLFKNDGLDFVVCQSASFTGDINNVVSEWKNIFSENAFEDHVCASICFLVPGPLFRKSFLAKQSHLFDENIKCLEDWEFFSRILQHSPSFQPVNEVLVYYRVNQAGLLQQIYKSEIRTLDCIKGYHSGFRIFLEEGTITPRIRKFLVKRYIPLIRKSLRLKYLTAFKLSIKYAFEIKPGFAIFQIMLEPFRHSIKLIKRTTIWKN
jgi:glycosyltransferase involved in cell wall biosynthesis